jgi:hypothetical protein
MFRHGDVLIVPAAKLPGKLKKVKHDKGRVILAYGEVTGHAHAIVAPGSAIEMYEADGGERFIRVADAPVELKHEEHGTITLPAGDYRIVHQREYTPEEIRRVAD